MPPSIAREPTPDWLNKKNHPAAFPQAGDAGRVTGSKPLMPTLQPSVGTAMAQKMSNVHVAAPAAAPAPSASATAAPACGNAAGMEKSGPSASTIGEETDEESEHELTPEEQKNDEHVKNVEAVIAAAEAAGFTFGKTKWVAAETFVNNKEIFDDAGVDVTECVFEGRKEISLNQVKSKLAELRAVEQSAVGLYAGGLSQEPIGEEEEDEVVYSDDEYSGLSKQTLDAKKEQLEIDLAVAEKKKEVDPIRIAFRKFNKELITLKGSLAYDGKAQELTFIRDYYDERYFKKKEFVQSLSVWQLKYMSDMFLAEIEKRELPRTIKDLKKNLTKVKSALQDIKFEQIRKQEDKKSKRTKKRAAAAIADAIGTPKGKRARR